MGPTPENPLPSGYSLTTAEHGTLGYTLILRTPESLPIWTRHGQGQTTMRLDREAAIERAWAHHRRGGQA